MTPKEAAKVIGCSHSNVLHLIRKSKIKATVYEMPGGYYYSIAHREARRYRDANRSGAGWPRGQSRN